MLSVTTPVNLRWPFALLGALLCDKASADTMSRLKTSRFIMGPLAQNGVRRDQSKLVEVRAAPFALAALAPTSPGLFASSHQVGGGGARVHDPHATLLAVFRQAEGLGGCARNGDGHVRAKVLGVRTHLVIPDRSELGFYARPIFFSCIERG